MTRNAWLLILAIVIILAVGVGLSQIASTQPDGLEHVAQDQGFADAANEHVLQDAPLAGYGENLDGSSRTATAVSALIGIIATAGLGFVVLRIARKSPDTHSAA
ncbi:MAG: PDGLE domain-containing protein [Actinomycetia bacterium]|nr:PDGLE domain-containing protein [Actinomycetes bacterium]